MLTPPTIPLLGQSIFWATLMLAPETYHDRGKDTLCLQELEPESVGLHGCSQEKYGPLIGYGRHLLQLGESHDLLIMNRPVWLTMSYSTRISSRMFNTSLYPTSLWQTMHSSPSPSHKPTPAPSSLIKFKSIPIPPALRNCSPFLPL